MKYLLTIVLWIIPVFGEPSKYKENPGRCGLLHGSWQGHFWERNAGTSQWAGRLETYTRRHSGAHGGRCRRTQRSAELRNS
jgi:hypothetical protein